jgi:RNA 2',3'-cyclic 3'-phosphodiesterase
MRRRLFFALNLDARTVSAIQKLESELLNKFNGEVRFMLPENWHITVSFLGEQEDNQLIGIMNAARAAAKHFQPTEIAFDRILYGPPGKFPRMIWLETDRGVSRNINELKIFLEDRLASERVPCQRETRPFVGHITLARFVEKIKTDSRTNLENRFTRRAAVLGVIFEMGSLPRIEKPAHLKFTAESLDLMESELKKAGAEYAVLQKFPFGK